MIHRTKSFIDGLAPTAEELKELESVYSYFLMTNISDFLFNVIVYNFRQKSFKKIYLFYKHINYFSIRLLLFFLETL
jgi:hypothetical protein